MKYTKPPLSVDDQIGLLTRRGMAFGDVDAAHHTLSHINYYRLRAYWLPFEDSAGNAIAGDHAFAAGTSFETVLSYYTFDQRLKLLLMDAVERVEIALRTRWAHVLAMRYGCHAFLDAANFRNLARHTKCLQSLQDEVSRSHETFIKHYLSTYTDPPVPPIWAVCEVLTLGQLSQWLDNLKRRQDRQDIASAFGFDEVVVCAFAHHLATVRNLCAHHSRVWNRKFTIRMKLPMRPVAVAACFNPAQDQRIYNTLLMLALCVQTIHPGSRWVSRVVKLVRTMHPRTTDAMGFPLGWESMPVWANAIKELATVPVDE
ncbi:MAG: Abi family protein [Betaproteobacteria bacterium]